MKKLNHQGHSYRTLQEIRSLGLYLAPPLLLLKQSRDNRCLHVQAQEHHSRELSPQTRREILRPEHHRLESKHTLPKMFDLFRQAHLLGRLVCPAIPFILSPLLGLIPSLACTSAISTPLTAPTTIPPISVASFPPASVRLRPGPVFGFQVPSFIGSAGARSTSAPLRIAHLFPWQSCHVSFHGESKRPSSLTATGRCLELAI